METTTHLNNTISTAGMCLAINDLRALRVKVRRAMVEVPWGMLSVMDRKACIRILLVDKFGASSIDKYETQCKAWDQDRAYIEYGIESKEDQENDESN